MTQIKLTINNRTKLDLLFRYDESNYDVPAQRTLRITVEAGHMISVSDPNHSKATRSKRYVEPNFFNHSLEKDTVVDCRLTGWQLELNMGVDII